MQNLSLLVSLYISRDWKYRTEHDMYFDDG